MGKFDDFIAIITESSDRVNRDGGYDYIYLSHIVNKNQ